MEDDLTKIANDDTLTNVGKVVKAYKLGLEDSKYELLEELDSWRDEIVSKDCEETDEVEIMNHELKDWIEKQKETRK